MSKYIKKQLVKFYVNIYFQIGVNIIGLPNFHNIRFSYKEYVYTNNGNK
jgi:hypothetical protein